MDDVTLAAGRTKFEVVAKSLKWPEAHADAVASGGRLAVFPYGSLYDGVIAKIRNSYGDSLWLGLTDSVNAANTLLDTRRIPREVVVHQQAGELEINTFRGDL